MQIDGHHTGTYIAARLAGFNPDDASTIAYAAQYVDDATNDGTIIFADSHYMYARIASAHSMIDYNNLVQIQNHLAWLPFHFLPGNGQLLAGESPSDEDIGKMVCCPDSHVARDMLRLALRDRNKPRGLHRLGITMHVYADTFAHQGFIGALSAGNKAEDVTCGSSKLDKKIRDVSKEELLTKAWSEVKAFTQFVWESLQMAYREHKSLIKYWNDFFKRDPLGHAAVDTFPDQPFLSWSYRDWKGQTITRDNPTTFTMAFNMMVKAMQAWRADDASMELSKYPGMGLADATALENLVRTTTDPVGEHRHAIWCAAIAGGTFSFGAETICYQSKGIGSWKEAALGTVKKTDTGYEAYSYSPAFLESHWKCFHDALQAHRIDVVHEILPRYGICAA